ncbi:pentatricopeptide repeat-containing protein At2g36730 isoform X2 [Cucumis sativus]|uniref:pentatricopeptide repeat-containing protein At2g36730 isoform X2 n=1 Tax=Cucumis sativus TaxID=3659 RepID=UPI0005ED27D6|nr:pentatricopeptide repeat-containing protein At2g36730 isoform X2 [Cucumis sativus]
MVRLWISAVHQFFPINVHNYSSKPKFLSTKHQLLSLLNHCSSTNHLFEIHAQILVSGLQNDSFFTTELLRVAALSPSRNLSYGCSLLFHCHFHSATMPWNFIIRGYSSSDSPQEAISLFGEMRRRGVRPNNLTFPFLLKACATLATLQEDETTMVVILSACAELGNLSLGRWVHSQVVGRGMVLNVQLGTAFVDMYAKSGDVGCARHVFNCLKQKSVWTWSAMILGLAQHGFANEAIELFTNMMSSPIVPNHVTFIGVLCACSHAGLVDKSYHYFNLMERVYGIKPMMIHYGSMVDVLGRAGQVKEAYELIMSMPVEPDPIVWRTLLSACSGRDVNGGAEVAEEARKRLLELEPKRGGNVVMVANKFAELGMWKQAADYRRTMKDRGIKKMAGESCIELGGSLRKFFSGFDSRAAPDGIYDLLDGLNLHMQLTNF